jgi:hypothetical protein
MPVQRASTGQIQEFLRRRQQVDRHKEDFAVRV